MNINIFSVRDCIDSFEIVKILERKGVKANVFSIVKTNKKTLPNFKLKYDFIVLTSSKAVKCFLQYLRLYKKRFKKIPKTFVVGPETAKTLKKNGFIDFYQASGNSKSLLNLILSNTKIYSKGLWLCGRHRNSYIKDYLLKHKRFLKNRVVYEMYQKDFISEHLLTKLKNKEENYFLVNSSRNVSLLTMLLKKYYIFDKIKKNSIVVTMSKNIYNKSLEKGWGKNQLIPETLREKYLDKFIHSLNLKENSNG